MALKHRNGVSSRPVAPPVRETPPANLPIPPQATTPGEEAVRERAYQLWETAGCPEGDGVQFWYEAEQELNGQ